jgi:DDE superfamily endonuclease
VSRSSRGLCDHLMMLDFSPLVRAFSAQPFWLLWPSGGWTRRNAPDFFARRRAGAAWWSMSGRMTGSRRRTPRRGKVIGKQSPSTGPSTSVTFLDQIDHQAEPGLATHVICDNLATHKAAVVHKWLLAHPRFVLHFSPTCSSRLNQVPERWLAELQRRCLDPACSAPSTS